ncbi:MAG: serine/threonine-protein phosphatase [Dokdonella sp.]|uniref:PP2C family protein-serine/threonine phosphatase n=1 Tax=Dokdonella sp. TaxID=2291710 RepID=UPI0025BA6EB5|nr:PP2C family serine/threonine-protein phosphatase [Dokdonella sp.]MBZ0223881.1 serine/threonine-protein phosphatase [Dokdonella sp.]
MSIRIAYCMHRGMPHRQQDALLVGADVRQSANLRSQHVALDGEVLVALADGVAASPNAQLASQFVLNELPKVLQQHADWCQEGLFNGRHVRETHARLCAELAHRPQMHGSATTLVAAHIKGSRIAILNTGDSRAYLRSANGSVRQLSRDHTELQRLRDAGDADAMTEYASLYGALSDCLVADSLESDFAIHRETLTLAPNDLLVLCTDGVHDILGDARWRDLIAEHSDSLTLVHAARTAVLAAGASDNFSVIAAHSQI